MSFWNTSTGEQATGEVQETNFDPIPKSWQTCMLETAEVDEYEGQRKIKLKARVVDGDYKNRVIFLNLKAFEGPDIKDSQRDRAIQMLMKLYQITKAKLPNGEPDDRSLAQLTDKPVDLYLDVWKITKANGDEATGNFLINVAAKGENAGKSAAGTKPAPMMAKGDIDGDIPF
jgi:hypothetical protein